MSSVPEAERFTDHGRRWIPTPLLGSFSQRFFILVEQDKPRDRRAEERTDLGRERCLAASGEMRKGGPEARRPAAKILRFQGPRPSRTVADLHGLCRMAAGMTPHTAPTDSLA